MILIKTCHSVLRADRDINHPVVSNSIWELSIVKHGTKKETPIAMHAY
jgi:hypothetical protein